MPHIKEFVCLTVMTVVNALGHAFAIALFNCTPVSRVCYHCGDMYIDIHRGSIYGGTHITAEARSLNLWFTLHTFMGVAFVVDLCRVAGQTWGNILWNRPLTRTQQGHHNDRALTMYYTNHGMNPMLVNIIQFIAFLLGVEVVGAQHAHGPHRQQLFGGSAETITPGFGTTTGGWYSGEAYYWIVGGIVMTTCIIGLVGIIVWMCMTKDKVHREDLRLKYTSNENWQHASGEDYEYCWVYLVLDNTIKRHKLRQTYPMPTVWLGWLKDLKGTRRCGEGGLP